jgi:SpoIID/LytB domain protein
MRFRHPSSALAGTLAIASLTLVGAGPAPAAPPRAAERIGVPDHATLTIRGRGYGHGHGLSQYGAEGAARKGLSAQKIVRFYYPHTKAGRAHGPVQVLIEASIGRATTVVARSGLRVRDLAKGTTTRVPAHGPASKATRWRMTGDGSGGTQVLYRTGGWHVWRTLQANGEFESTGAPLTLVLPGSRVTYRGTLRSMGSISATTHRITVNKVPLDAYVQGVIPQEMFPSWHQAALRAQAIAARTYAAFEKANASDPRYNLCDTTSCQVYGGRSAETPTTNQATQATKGQVRTYHGGPAFTQFSSSNGGWLAKGSEPYLVAKKDPYDGWKGNPVHTWSTRVSARAIEKAFGLGNLRSISISARDGHGQWNGRVEDMKLVGSKRTVTPTGDDFRSRLGLRSTWLDISVCGTCSRSMSRRGTP